MLGGSDDLPPHSSSLFAEGQRSSVDVTPTKLVSNIVAIDVPGMLSAPVSLQQRNEGSLSVSCVGVGAVVQEIAYTEYCNR